MLKQFKEKGNTRMVRKLEEAPVTLTDGTPDGYLKVRDKAMHRLGIGTTRDMRSVITGIFLPSLLCREYSLREKLNMWLGKSRAGVSILWDKMLATDLSKAVTRIDLPVYFFEGIYDYTCSFIEAKAFFEQLTAPLKGFYTFEHSAHSPLLEEPGKMLRILRADVLAGVNNLADSK